MPRWRIWYDDQCEICQASLVWLRLLDKTGRVEAIPVSDCLDGRASRPPGTTDDDLLRQMHALSPDGRLLIGAPAFAAMAREFPQVGWLGWLLQLPVLRTVAARCYGWIAANRYSLSRCRGGACRAARVDMVRRKSSWRAFQLCRFAGWTLITPVSFALWAGRLLRQAHTWWRTRGRAVHLLEGRLTIYFLSGGISSSVPLLFGELFAMSRYRSLLVDPGGSRMRRMVARHLRRSGAGIFHVAPTHAHEEHCGNLDLAAAITGAKLHAHPRAAPLLTAPPQIPWMRQLVIGQPPAVRSPIEPLEGVLRIGRSPADELLVLQTPGHCDDHVSFYAPADKLLLVGDAFMGTHFSSPNDDVNHRAWIASLERLLELDIEIMVEGHGHVHTTRADVIADLERQGADMLASRISPRELLLEKLQFLRWVGDQIELGEAEGLPPSAVRATVFPWTQRWSYASALQDKMAATVSLGGFGRHKLTRSFQRPGAEGGGRLPLVYEVVWHAEQK